MKRKKRLRSHDRIRLRRIEWILIGVMAVSGVMLIFTLAGYARARSAYASARSLAVTTPAPATPVPTLAPQDTPSPAPLETPPVAIDFDAVRVAGKHVRGWLYSEGTNINYPVTYYSNNEYYLTHDYTGTRSSAGALFFDTRVQKQLSGDNLIIYGHHMKDRSMFGSLLQYQKQAYYDAHPTMYLLTLDQNYRVDVFAGRFVDTDERYFPIWFSGEQARKTFVQTAIAGSDFVPADPTVRENARILSLVTCAYSNYLDDAKYQVLGWLTEIG